MTLVTINDCKAVVRKQSNDEDAWFTTALAAAYGTVQSYLRRPIIAEERTFRIPRGEPFLSDTIILPIYPASPLLEDSDGYTTIAAATLTDADAVLVPDTDYFFDERIAVFSAVTGVTFATYPYTVVATVGLSAHPDYALVIEPIINAALLDIVADRWMRRVPSITNDSEGGGVSTSFAGEGIPARVRDELEPWRMVRAR